MTAPDWRPTARRAWRAAAFRLPLALRRELPLWGYLDVFVSTYTTIPAAERANYLRYVATNRPYLNAIRRVGGFRSACKAVLGNNGLPEEIAVNFRDPVVCPKPGVADVAASMIMAGQFCGIPMDLVRMEEI